jgi:ankyrin repeat protein
VALIRASETKKESKHLRHFCNLVYRVNIKFEASSALIWAAHHNKASIAKRILDLHWKDINIINRQSPLVIAAHAGSLSVLEAILQRADVDINIQLHSGTALWWAARNGHTAILKCLLWCKNIRANNPGESNRTPLAVSIAWGPEDTSMVLLRSGLASINAIDDHGMTPLLLALRH